MGLAIKHINQLLYLFLKFLCLVTGQLVISNYCRDSAVNFLTVYMLGFWIS